MKLTPVITEKSMMDAKEGKFTFYVLPSLNKGQIQNGVEKAFGVTVVKIRTVIYKGRTKRNMYGKTVSIKSKKKAIVELKKGQTIDLFETKEKK